MKNYNNNQVRRRPLSAALLGMLIVLPLLLMGKAEATAPRISPKLFGEEKHADIVGYQTAPTAAANPAESALTVAIVSAAFAAMGKKPSIDVLPSRQLAKYALTQHDAAALIGDASDLTAQEAANFRVVPFYLRSGTTSVEPLSLIVGKNHPRADELLHDFQEGLRKIIANGQYRELMAAQPGQTEVPADYFQRLERYLTAPP